MYEPYGYDDGTNYISKKDQIERELAINRHNDRKEFASVEYNTSLQAFVFRNVKGKAVGQANMKDIIAQELLNIDSTYDANTKELVIIFKSGQEVRISVEDLIDVNEAGNGLMLDDTKFSIKIASDNEHSRVDGNEYLTVDENGLRVVGVNLAVEKEEERAVSEEARLDRRIDDEIDRAMQAERDLNDLINAESARAMSEEQRIETKLNTEIVDRNTHNNEHDAAIAHLQAAITNESVARGNAITTINGYITSIQAEINSLKARVTALENRL